MASEPNSWWSKPQRRLIPFGERVLLSTESGWYDPGLPDCRAGCVRGYTYLSESFLPRLREAGVDEATVGKLTRENPFHAFARPRWRRLPGPERRPRLSDVPNEEERRSVRGARHRWRPSRTPPAYGHRAGVFVG